MLKDIILKCLRMGFVVEFNGIAMCIADECFRGFDEEGMICDIPAPYEPDLTLCIKAALLCKNGCDEVDIFENPNIESHCSELAVLNGKTILVHHAPRSDADLHTFLDSIYTKGE